MSNIFQTYIKIRGKNMVPKLGVKHLDITRISPQVTDVGGFPSRFEKTIYGLKDDLGKRGRSPLPPFQFPVHVRENPWNVRKSKGQIHPIEEKQGFLNDQRKMVLLGQYKRKKNNSMIQLHIDRFGYVFQRKITLDSNGNFVKDKNGKIIVQESNLGNVDSSFPLYKQSGSEFEGGF